MIELDADPAAVPDIGWLEKDLGCRVDEPVLEAGGYRQPHRTPTIVVMIGGEHHKDPLAHKEGWLSM